jgi:hypothetical protein
MEETEARVGKMAAQLEHWGAKLDKLAARADKAGTDAKADYHKRLDDLKAKVQVGQAKLVELKAASGEKWETIKTGAEAVWNEIEVAFEKLKS